MCLFRDSCSSRICRRFHNWSLVHVLGYDPVRSDNWGQEVEFMSCLWRQLDVDKWRKNMRGLWSLACIPARPLCHGCPVFSFKGYAHRLFMKWLHPKDLVIFFFRISGSLGKSVHRDTKFQGRCNEQFQGIKSQWHQNNVCYSLY